MIRVAEYIDVMGRENGTGYGKLNIVNGRVQYPEGHNDNPLRGYSGENAFGLMKKLGSKNGVEYGIVGRHIPKGSRYRGSYGWMGYKIEDGKLIILNYGATTTTEASKWIREDLFNEEAPWRVLGTL